MGSNISANYELIVNNPEVAIYLKTADDNFAAIGYKEHGLRHARLTANIAGNVLKFLGYSERDIELARIAGYLHDIGNAIAQRDHAQTGAVLSEFLLHRIGFSYDDIFPVITAIGSHEDKDELPPDALAAAVILGDKSDVNRGRVRQKDLSQLDTHGRVNYACIRAFLRVEKDSPEISLELTIDTSICSVMDYFEIFLSRMNFCRLASKVLKKEFVLYINKDRFL